MKPPQEKQHDSAAACCIAHVRQYSEALQEVSPVPASARRTATYDASVIERASRVRTSPTYRRALVDLTGHEPGTESALFNELAKIALEVIERRALEVGYRQLAEDAASERDDVDEFLEAQALSGFTYEDDGDMQPLLDFLTREGST
jgi:hypothetical protein